ncbi:MAG: hypothetical protein R2939_13895 [Kofleriaceae bacterium]
MLPPMEICFKNVEVDRPVYDYGVKQEWEKHVFYECPAKVNEAELKAIEKIARATYWALDCRDVARVDLRMDAEGRIYVLEVNPLPGLTPDYSDLVLISKAVGMQYDQLIAEIMVGGLRRLRDKRREERELEREREAAAQAKVLAPADKERAADKGGERAATDKAATDKAATDKAATDKVSDRSADKASDKASDKATADKTGGDKTGGDKSAAAGDKSSRRISKPADAMATSNGAVRTPLRTATGSDRVPSPTPEELVTATVTSSSTH